MAKVVADAGESPSASIGPRRHVPTGVLLLALLAFPLPWINLGCGEQPPGRPRKEYFSVTQSGLQASYGGTTLHAGSMSEAEALSLGLSKRPLDGAPLLFVYAAVTALGLVAGLFMRRRRGRARVMGACSVAALVILLIQLRVGLPLAREFRVRSGAPEPLYHLYMELHYTPWFWLAIVATAVTPLAVWAAHRPGGLSWYPVLFRWEQIRGV